MANRHRSGVCDSGRYVRLGWARVASRRKSKIRPRKRVPVVVIGRFVTHLGAGPLPRADGSSPSGAL
eukprot:6405149-Pyramimonas_sp.AAC.1